MDNKLTQLVTDILRQLEEPAAMVDQLAELLGEIQRALSARYAALVTRPAGQWRVDAESGSPASLPYEMMADALDDEQPREADGWLSVPLPSRGSSRGAVLAVYFSKPVPGELFSQSTLVASWLQAARRVLQLVDRQQRRVHRLERMLDIAAQWEQTLDMDQLLAQMAAAATDLMGAERASIFLWDRANKVLVGRPALGVDEDELRIPDTAGVVGQVVQNGQPHRVGRGDGQDEIDRRVDKQLGFDTRTLLCVPLIGRGGERFGAFELINKLDGDFTDDDEIALTDLAQHAAVALENTQQFQRLLSSRKQMADEAAAGLQLIGQCPAITALRSTIRRVADTDLAVLILGQNGTGKEVAARSVHYLSPRRDEPFIAVNCAALTETLLESELFGHEKGAFTDAHETRIGKFELASAGTLFLDEIGDLSPGGQAKLLRILEEKVVVRVGGSVPIPIDTRVIAATNQNLAQRVRERQFREDLFFRLNVVSLELPPLRDRGDDILLLAEHFLQEFCSRAGRKPPKFAAAARKRLLGHEWPGNVRELRNLMERIAYLSNDTKVDVDELAFILFPHDDQSAFLPSDMSLTDATREFQVQYIRKQIERAQGNMTDAAGRLGLHRANLYRKMRQLEMQNQP
jgi:Nif-specific regulatory protein